MNQIQSLIDPKQNQKKIQPPKNQGDDDDIIIIEEDSTNVEAHSNQIIQTQDTPSSNTRKVNLNNFLFTY